MQDVATIIFSLFGVLVTIALYIALFLLLRKLVLWYWKINRLVEYTERLYKIQWMLHHEQFKNEQVILINKDTRRETTMTKSNFLQYEGWRNYTLK